MPPLRAVRHLLQDLHFGVRLLRRRPSFAVAAVLLLGLGIGVNTAVFSLIDAALLRPLPVPAPDELLLLRWVSGPRLLPESIDGYVDAGGASGEASSTSFSWPAYLALRDAARDVAEAVAFAEVESLSVRDGDDARIARGQLVSGDYFGVLGVPAARGRVLGPEDDREAGSASVAVLDHRFWRERFRGDETILGRTLHLNGAPFVVVGVLPPGFRGSLQLGSQPDLYVSVAARSLLSVEPFDRARGTFWWLQILARLRPGSTPAQVRARLEPEFRRAALLGVEGNAPNADLPRLLVEDGRRGLPEMRRDFRMPLTLVGGMAALVLLVACANLAGLLLGQSAARRRELAVRAALGAGRGRLVRQLLTEALLLGGLGGMVGFLVAAWGTDTAFAILPVPPTPDGLLLSLNGRVFAIHAAVAASAVAFFGLLPSIRSGRAAEVRWLRGSGGVEGGSRLGLGGALIVFQVAVSTLLLIGAGWFVRSLWNLRAVDPGFEAKDLLLFRIDPSLAGYQGERLLAVYPDVARRLEALPGVAGVTFSRYALLENSASIVQAARPGQPADPGSMFLAWMLPCRFNFLEAMGTPVLRGRSFDAAEERAGAAVAVINESLGRILFGDENPVGRSFALPDGGGRALLIVGLARDASYGSLRQGPPPMLYVPFTLRPGMASRMTFEMRIAGGGGSALLPAVRAAVAAAAPGVPVFAERTQEEQIDRHLLRERQFAGLASVFGVGAILLAAVGFYGVLANAVRRRSGEIAVRLALGAAPGRLLGMVLRQALVLGVLGCAAGLAGAAAAGRLAATLLYGLTPSDPSTQAGIVALALGVVAAAAWFPARRAARTDPAAVLRRE